MSLNWREIDLVLAELSLTGARVQRITQPHFSQLVLGLYHRHESLPVLISMEQGKTRIHRTTAPLTKPETPPRFQQLLHSRLRGGTITAVEHVHQDRIVCLTIRRADDEYLLWARLWGGSANVVLTEPDGTIVDAMYRRPKRAEVTGSRFEPPPPGEAARAKAVTLSPRGFLLNENYTEGVDAASAGARNLDHHRSGYPCSTAIEEHYRGRTAEERLTRLRREAHKALASREQALHRRYDELARKHRESENSERLRVIADAIMAQLHRVEPGLTWVKVENPYNPEEVLAVQLDPSGSAAENAERYYRKYKKARSSTELVQRELAETTEALQRTRANRQQVDALEDPAQLETLIAGAGRRPKPREAARSAPPGLQFQSGNLQLYLGRTALENDELLRRYVRGNDLWMHVRERAGAYVFVKVPKGKSVPLETLLDAGNLALLYSKAKAAGRALVQYTQVKNLRRTKDGPRGRVIPYHEKTIHIVLDQERLERLRRPTNEVHS